MLMNWKRDSKLVYSDACVCLSLLSSQLHYLSFSKDILDLQLCVGFNSSFPKKKIFEVFSRKLFFPMLQI